MGESSTVKVGGEDELRGDFFAPDFISWEDYPTEKMNQAELLEPDPGIVGNVISDGVEEVGQGFFLSGQYFCNQGKAKLAHT